MFHKEKPDYNRRQYGFYTIDELVPKDHFLRQVDSKVDFDFIYDLVEDTYSPDNGRPSFDPVMLVKIPLIKCFYGIRSMRQTMKDIEVNVAYRWFLGLTLDDKVPHFTTYGKNYSRRFQDKELISEIFSQVLSQALYAGLIDPSEIFVDGTHIKAAANSHKYRKEMVDQQAKFMSEQLAVEIDLDRKKYDASYDCYVCPENQVLSYRTTTREGYREYKSNPKVCVSCPLLSVYTQSKNFQKVVTRHVWKDALEFCEEIRHQREMKELYKKRKETIERLFGTAKEYHNLRYTREKGKSKMEDQVGLTLACLNIKKLVKWIGNIPFYFSQIQIFEWNIR